MIRSSQIAVGLDIGNTAIKLVGVRVGDVPIVEFVEVIDYVRDEIVEEQGDLGSDHISAILRELKKKYRLKSRRISWAISGTEVRVYRLSVPDVADSEVDEIVTFGLRNVVPWELDETEIAYYKLPSDYDEDNELAVGAVQVSFLGICNSIMDDAGFSVRVIEPSAIALYNALETIGALPNDRPMALLEIGFEKTEIVVAMRGKKPVFHTAPYGTASWKKLPEAFSVAEKGTETASLTESKQMKHPMQNFTDEVLAVCRNFQALENSPPVNLISLTGGGALRPAVGEAIGHLTKLRTRIFNPSEQLRARFDIEETWRKNAPLCSIALGSALRGALA